MKIALIGYGKMGKTIEQIAIQRGHDITLKIDLDNLEDLNAANLSKTDAVIEFTGPHSAFNNVMKCLQAGASDYIAKPVNTDQLLSLLRVWLYR